MQTRGEFRIDPGCLETDGLAASWKWWSLYRTLGYGGVLKRVPILTRLERSRQPGCRTHTTVPAAFCLPHCCACAPGGATDGTGQPMRVACQSQVVLARDREEGSGMPQAQFHRPGGTRKNFRRTAEERLARSLAATATKSL